MERPQYSAPPDVAWISGGAFCVGSDRSYSEKVPVHQVGGFWIDRKPVTNRQFKQFVRATGHKAFAEVLTDPKSSPGSVAAFGTVGVRIMSVVLKHFGEQYGLLSNRQVIYAPVCALGAALVAIA